MAVGGIMSDMEFSDYGLGGPLLGAETVGVDLANPLLGGPEQGGLYTGGMGAGPSRTAAARQQAILNVNPYIAPSQGVNLEPITSLRSGGQTGYYFANELGLPARYGEGGTPGFVPVDPNATYRLVKGGTDGSVVYSGAGEEGLRNVFQQANKLTLDDPKKAYWGVEVLDPATGQYKRVAENKGPNGLGIVGDIAGVALPIAAAIATGGASLGVQIAAGAAAGGLGGFLAGKDPLTSALIGGATAGLGNVTGANKAIGGILSDASGAVKSALIPEIAKQTAASAGGDIVVTGLSNLAKGAASGLLQGAASGVTGNLYSPTTQPAPTQQPVQEPVQPSLSDTIVVSGNKVPSGSGLPFGAAFPVPVGAILSGALTAAQPLPTQQPTTQQPEDIVVTGTEKPVISAEVLATVPAIGGLLAGTGGGASNVVNGIDQATGDIVVKAPQSVLPPPPLLGVEAALPAITVGALTPTQTAGPQPSTNGGVLGTGLNVPQILSIGGIGADLLKSLLAGGGGAEAGVPYVSQFGPGVGLGVGRDMRANPNIADYERYGFGPEAMFFQPGYGLLNSAAPAPAPTSPQAQPIMATNPRYEPLI